MRLLLASAFALLVCAVIAETVRGAPLTWGTATTWTGDTDVDTSGTLIGAYGFDIASNVTVNGVTFQNVANTSAVGNSNDNEYTLTFGNFSFEANIIGSSPFKTPKKTTPTTPYTNLSTSYKALVGPSMLIGAATTLTITGLTVGDNYQFEVWSGGPSSGTSAPGAGSGVTLTVGSSSVTLTGRTPATSGGVGEFVIGTFTADSSSEVVDFSSGSVDAMELREVPLSSVPEPATTALLFGVGALGFAALSRRKALVSALKS